MAGGHHQPVVPARLPRSSAPPGRRRRSRRRQEEARGTRSRSRGTGTGRHPGPGAGRDRPRRPGRSGRPLGGRRRRPWRQGQRQLPDQPQTGALVRRAGGEGSRAVVRPRAGPGGRCGPGRVPQRGQEHAHLTDLGGQAQDRRLPLHHPRAPPGGGAGRRRLHVHGGRHPRAGGGGGHGQGARPPVPPPHHPLAGAGGAGRAGSGHRDPAGRAVPRAPRRARALPTGPGRTAPPGGGVEARRRRPGR